MPFATRVLVYPPEPATEGGFQGKFVQLLLEEQEYLIFAPFSLAAFHNQIVARFLTDHRIDCRWLDAQTLEVSDPQPRILGGGRFRVDPAAGRLELWDNSQAYGRFVDDGLAGRIAGAGHPWSGYAVTIT